MDSKLKRQLHREATHHFYALVAGLVAFMAGALLFKTPDAEIIGLALLIASALVIFVNFLGLGVRVALLWGNRD